LKELVEEAGLSDQLNLSIVQTAYANGSSTNYIENVMVRKKLIIMKTLRR
jgi:phosphoacetylglucosamine mutase